MRTDIPDLIAGALGVSRGTAYDMMREALAEQPAQQEPVGQIGRDANGLVGHIYDDRKVKEGDKLYTTPQAQPRGFATLAREPLTVKEIAEFVGTHEYGPEQLKWFRFGEAAHGINAKGNT